MTRSDRYLRRLVFWLAFALAGALFIAGFAGLAVWFAGLRGVTSNLTSMENTIRPGDKLLYVPGSAVRRGDVVVERLPIRPGAPDLLLRRVIGLPGDHVSCCDKRGRVVVNGKPLDESYLYPKDAPSTGTFSVILANRRYWLLGDHRSIALDSRARGPIPQADIAGRVVAVIRGMSFTMLRTPRTFVADGLAPADTGTVLPVGSLLLAAGALVVLLVLAIYGIAGSVIRRRRLAAVRPTAARWPTS